MKSIAMAGLVAFILSGCVDHISESRGTQIEIVPVTYQLRLRTDEVSTATSRVDTFINKHSEGTKKSRWNIKSKGEQGQVLSKMVVTKLAERGVEPSRQDKSELASQSRFDLEVSVTILRTKLEICHQEQVGEYGYGSIGCNVDTSRWQSMVNPHKAI